MSVERSEAPKRLTPTLEVAKRLFALSGNRCAFPDCEHAIFDKDGILIAELCHIEAAEPGGQRFNNRANNEQRRQIENLLLLCHEHHKVTDNVKKFPISSMRTMKQRHEKKYEQAAEKIIQDGFIDHTSTTRPSLPKTLRRYADIHDLKKKQTESIRLTYSAFAEQLSRVPKSDRQLLCIIAERALDGAVTHNELRRITNSTGSKITESLRMLIKYKFIYTTEPEYGPEEIRLRQFQGHDSNMIMDFKDFSERASIPWPDIIVDLRFDLLD